MAKHEYRRTCRRCDHQWYIPEGLAKEKAPSKLQMTGAKMGSAGARMSLVSFSRKRKQAEVQRLEEKAARVAENSRCPSCGSSDFAQEKVRIGEAPA